MLGPERNFKRYEEITGQKNKRKKSLPGEISEKIKAEKIYYDFFILTR